MQLPTWSSSVCQLVLLFLNASIIADLLRASEAPCVCVRCRCAALEVSVANNRKKLNRKKKRLKSNFKWINWWPVAAFKLRAGKFRLVKKKKAKKKVGRYGHEQQQRGALFQLNRFFFLTACKSVIGNELETSGNKETIGGGSSSSWPG